MPAYTDLEKITLLKRIAHKGWSFRRAYYETGVHYNSLLAWDKKFRAGKIGGRKESPYKVTASDLASRVLIYDIETLPNLGYFWDTFSDRGIPLDFIVKPKSICTISWKWLGAEETRCASIKTPYEDRPPLEEFQSDWEKATHVVAHYSKFDKPFIAARLMANGMRPLAPVCDICTYKLAKAHFGRSLNGNKLDHLGTILGVGSKIKTSASLWVRCAAGGSRSHCRDVRLQYTGRESSRRGVYGHVALRQLQA